MPTAKRLVRNCFRDETFLTDISQPFVGKIEPFVASTNIRPRCVT